LLSRPPRASGKDRAGMGLMQDEIRRIILDLIG
jgi:hypothetical protein